MSKGILRHLRNDFLAGLLVVLPLFISIKILLWLFELALGLTSWVLVLFPEELRKPEALGVSEGAFELGLKVWAFVVTLVFILIVGVIAKNVLGRRLLRLSETLLMRVPLLNKIYGTVKQVTQTLWKSQKTVFNKVVLLEYPRPGLYSVGFITSETAGEIQERTKENVVNVFVPTVPNPTSGVLVMAPREQLTMLEMSVTDGFKLIISGGAVVPPPAPAEPASSSGAAS